jgi:xanthine/uracil permease
LRVWHLGENTGLVSLARASWITVVAICAIAAILFAISGYTGYTVTVIAVGLAAAVNLLPSP